MNDEAKWKLQHNHRVLISDIPDEVMQELFTKGIINWGDKEKISDKSVTGEKNDLLLRILRTKGPGVYTEFREILSRCGCKHLVDKLDQTPPNVYTDSGIGNSTIASQEDVLVAIQKELTQRYLERFRRINPLPWSGEQLRSLPDVYTDLMLNERDTYKRAQSSHSICLDDIFAPQKDCPCVKRVYIQGNSGSGKTVLCNKLAYDWATRKPGSMSKFSAVLFLEMMEGIVKSNLMDTIIEHLLPFDVKYKPLVPNCLNEYQSNILLIIDGYDELSALDKQNFESFLEGRYLHQVSCLVTSRPTNLEARHFDRRLTCNGFSLENARLFVDKYFDGKPKTYFKDLMDRVENSCYMRQLVRNPLNCLLLCVHWEENEQNNRGNLPRSLSQLFFSIIHIMKLRHQHKTDRGKRYATEYETFEDDYFLKGIKKLAFKGVIEGCREVFASTTLKGIPEGCTRVSLSEDEATDINCEDVVKMGILTRVQLKFSMEERFCFTQRHIQEVLAAMHFPQLSGADRRKYFRQFLAKPETTILIIFIMGVFKTNDVVLKELFDILAENNRHNYDIVKFGLSDCANAINVSFNKVTKPFTVSFHALNEAESKDNDQFVSLIATSMPRNLFLDQTCLRNHFLCHDISYSCFMILESMPCPERVMIMEVSFFKEESLKLVSNILEIFRRISVHDSKPLELFIYCDGRNICGYVSIPLFMFRLMECMENQTHIKDFFEQRVRSLNFLMPECHRLREMTSFELEEEMQLPRKPPVKLPPLVVYTERKFDNLDDYMKLNIDRMGSPEVAAFFFQKMNGNYNIAWRIASLANNL